MKFGFVLAVVALSVLSFSVSAAGLTGALALLKQSQNASGDWYFSTPWGDNGWAPQAAFASLALARCEGNSPNVSAGMAWLASNADSFPAWATGESMGDVEGSLLFSLSSAGFGNSVDASNLTSSLLAFQQPDGGVAGWFDCRWNGSACAGSNSYVSDSADTALALLGGSAAGTLNSTQADSLVGFLNSVQNADGSMNLTSSEAENAYEGLAPDLASTTAWYLLASKKANLPSSNATNALNYLNSISSSNYSACSGCGSYTVALCTWALAEWGAPEAGESAAYLLSFQNSSGGFSDSRRSLYPQPMPLDTAIAAVALEAAGERLECIPAIANVSYSIVLVNSTTQRVGVSASNASVVVVSISGPANDSRQASFNSSTGSWQAEFSPGIEGNYSLLAEAASRTWVAANWSGFFSVAGCQSDSNCSSQLPYCVHGKCSTQQSICGDGYCDSGESCSSCRGDCGQCQPQSSGGSGGSSYASTPTPSPTPSPTPVATPTATPTSKPVSPPSASPSPSTTPTPAGKPSVEEKGASAATGFAAVSPSDWAVAAAAVAVLGAGLFAGRRLKRGF